LFLLDREEVEKDFNKLLKTSKAFEKELLRLGDSFELFRTAIYNVILMLMRTGQVRDELYEAV